MKRSGCLAAFVLVIVPALAHAQMGGMMGGGMRRGQMGGGGPGMGGMGGMGGGGGMMGGGMMGGGMGGMGGGMAPADQVRRTVRVELEGGKTLEGHVELGPVRIHGELGSYAILPQKIASIRFLKPGREGSGGHAGQAKEGEAEADESEGPGEIRLKVATTTGEEIVGALQAPPVFRIELAYGSLVPQTQKLRTITFTDGQTHAPHEAKGEKAADAPHLPAPPLPPERRPTTAIPRYYRLGNGVLIASPVGDRVTFYDSASRKSRSIELSGTKDAPLDILPIVGPGVVALQLNGPKITRLAVLDPQQGKFYSLDLKPAAKGQAMPIVGANVAVYALGRHLCAFSARAGRWDVAELPESVIGVPTVHNDGASIEGAGHIFTFAAQTGKWEHIDIRTILDVAGAEERR
ncbi:MAG: hypothetical protein ACYC61_09785 [Isosphaeraceae bacterium]